MGEGGRTTKKAVETPLEKDWRIVSAFLREHPELIQKDAALLAEIGLRLKTENIVDFGPAALAKLTQAKRREKAARIELEETVRSNFDAQAQTHAAAVDILDSRNHSDLARRLEEIAQLRFGMVSGVIAVETDTPVPPGWRPLGAGMTDDLLGPQGLSRMGKVPHLETLFWQQAEAVRSVALIRIALGSPMRQGVLAFGAPDAKAFTPEMGVELIAFLARVVERTADRWPLS
jgi:uncharacterized protein YigA (DUF484 family)